MSKNVIILMDGTGSEFRRNYTNVARMLGLLPREDVTTQRVFYHPGVGTRQAPGTPAWMLRKWGSQAFGYGLKAHVLAAYHYLMTQYVNEDRLFVFGFSRGAYQAEILADILWRFGLLHSHNFQMIPSIWKYYIEDTRAGLAPRSDGPLKRTLTRPCRVHVMGLWDSVESLGWLYSRRIAKAATTPEVAHGYHALSLDERRRQFQPSRWDLGLAPPDHLEQVYFAGCHSDVGGWYPDKGLPDIALGWMLEGAERQGLELIAGWQDVLQPNPLGPMHDSFRGAWRVLGWLSGGPRGRRPPTGARVHDSVRDRLAADPSYDPPLPERPTFVSHPHYEAIRARDLPS